MLEDLKKKLFFTKFEILWRKAVKEGKITNFEDEIYDEMSDTIIACLPVSLYIKHSKHLFPIGTCYDRSLYMFLALNDAILCRGNNKDLEYNYGKGHGGHGWVEVGDYVYDPAIMLKFDKETYYKLYGTTDITRTDKETYLREHKDFVDSVVSTNFDDFRPGGVRRLDLGILVIQVQALARMIDDEEYKKDLADYLALIEYDADQIQEERNRVIQDMLQTSGALDVISGNELTNSVPML